MTPEQRAQRIITLRWPLPCGDMLGEMTEKDIATAIREAVAEEREACAVICERVYAENRRMGLTQRPCSDEAAAIRVQHLFE